MYSIPPRQNDCNGIADNLKDLKYLDNVINEALRHNGLITNLQGFCTKDYRIPDTDFTIIKGTLLMGSFLALPRSVFLMQFNVIFMDFQILTVFVKI